MPKGDDSEEFLFVEEDLDSLRLKVSELEKTYKDAQSGHHEATTHSSETWHDNPAFDDVQQRSKMYRREHSKLNAVLTAAKLLDPAIEPHVVVAIGTRVQFILNERAKDELVVCSYRCYHDKETHVSYDSPMGKALLGTKPGDKVSYKVGERVMEVEITGIAE